MYRRLTPEDFQRFFESQGGSEAPPDIPGTDTTEAPPAPKAGKKGKKAKRPIKVWTPDEVLALITSKGLSVRKIKSLDDGGTLYELDSCPFDPTHVNGSAFLILTKDGRLIFNCHHDSCSGHHIGELLVGCTTDEAPDDGDGIEGRLSPADRALIVLLAPDGLDLFHDPKGSAYFSTTVDGVRQNYLLRSRGGKSRINQILFNAFGRTIPSNAMAVVLDTLAAEAEHNRPEFPVFIRVANTGCAVFLDLGDSNWSAIGVTPQEWKLLNSTEIPVKFIRSSGMEPLPEPKRGRSIDALRKFLNTDDSGFALLVAWIISALHGAGPFPIGFIHGEHGSGKSTVARMIRLLIDPNSAGVRTLPKDPRDMMIAASNAWVLNFDNLSDIRPAVSDLLCILATGGGFATRALFTDMDEVIFNVKRAILLNGIPELLGRPDLADRSLTANLTTIDEKHRRSEDEIWREFYDIQPFILGALLDLLSHTLAELPNVVTEDLPRMADFAKLGMAMEKYAPWPSGLFIKSLRENRLDSAIGAIEGDSFGSALVDFIKKRKEPWEGTHLGLLRELQKHHLASSSDWPTGPRLARSRLDRLKPELRLLGVHIEHKEQRDSSSKRERKFRISYLPPSAPSGTSENDEPNVFPFRTESEIEPTPSTIPSASSDSFSKNMDGTDGPDGPVDDSLLF